MDSLYSSYKERYDAAIERIDKESPHRICLCWVICKISLLQKSEGMAATIPSDFCKRLILHITQHKQIRWGDSLSILSIAASYLSL
jgi:hypothetical protein